MGTSYTIQEAYAVLQRVGWPNNRFDEAFDVDFQKHLDRSEGGEWR